MTKALHVTFPNATTDALVAEAARRKLTPQVLAGAIVRAALDGQLVDGILDGDDARELAGGFARDMNGMTRIQTGVLYLIGLHTSRDGACHYSAGKMVELMPGTSASPSGVQSALAGLRALGLIRTRTALSVRGVRPHALTAAGRQLFEQMAGQGSEGGEG